MSDNGLGTVDSFGHATTHRTPIDIELKPVTALKARIPRGRNFDLPVLWDVERRFRQFSAAYFHITKIVCIRNIFTF
jgi:hypothetical protein